MARLVGCDGMLGLSDALVATHAHELTATRRALDRCTALSLAAVRNREELVAAVSAARDSEHVNAAFATRLRDVKERRAALRTSSSEGGAAGSNVRHVITSHRATPRHAQAMVKNLLNPAASHACPFLLLALTRCLLRAGGWRGHR